MSSAVFHGVSWIRLIRSECHFSFFCVRSLAEGVRCCDINIFKKMPCLQFTDWLSPLWKQFVCVLEMSQIKAELLLTQTKKGRQETFDWTINHHWRDDRMFTLNSMSLKLTGNTYQPWAVSTWITACLADISSCMEAETKSQLNWAAL